MKKILVNLGNRSYNIFIGVKIEDLGAQIKGYGFSPNVMVVTNPTIKRLYFNKLKQGLLQAGYEVSVCTIGDGETYKTLNTVNKIYISALKSKLDRRSPIIALGGGVVGDIAGFSAATYLRGVPLIQVPTTLLAMVDSSVGGKTAVDLKDGKNLIGAFYQPKLVWIDTATLKTLPERHIRNGFAEVIKYGIIANEDFFKYLEKIIGKIKNDNYSKIIYFCCQEKAKVVEKDEFEEKGLREILNFGHTFGHAIETITGYKKYLHGEAVAIGMNMAGKLAEKIGIFNNTNKIANILQLTGLPINLEEKYSPDKFILIMQKDKKVREGKFRFVLPLKIGKVVVRSDVPSQLIKEVL